MFVKYHYVFSYFGETTDILFVLPKGSQPAVWEPLLLTMKTPQQSCHHSQAHIHVEYK